MPYALVLSGGQRVSIPSKTMGANSSFWIDFEISTYATQNFLGNSTSSNQQQIYPIDATTIGWRGATTTNITLSESIPLNTRHYLEFVNRADNKVEIFNISGDSIGVSTTTVGSIIIALIGAASGRSFAGVIYTMGITPSDGPTQIYINESDPDATTFGDGTLIGGTWEFYSSGTTPIAFSGTIPTLSYAVDEIVSVDLSTYFSGSETPFTFANTGTALTGSGLTLSSAGLLSGTYTGTEITGVIVTGTDTATDTAASNAFNIVTAAVTYDSDVAIAWPIFSVAVDQESTAPALPTFTSEPLKDNTNTLLASEPLDYVAFYDNSDGSLVLRVTGISTNASGVFTVSNAALSSGVTYKVDWKVTSQVQGGMPAKAAV